MKQTKRYNFPFFAAHALLIGLICAVLRPGVRMVSSPAPFLAAIALIELLYLGQLLRRHKRGEPCRSTSEIMVLAYALLLLWELGTTQFSFLNVMLFPSPENVFALFRTQWQEMLLNAAYSLELLLTGFLGGVFLGTFVGILVGWISPLREVLHPIFKVLAPIPPMIISPYIMVLMPSFRSASVVLVLFTVFLFVVLNTIETVTSIDRNILDSARAMNLSTPAMIFEILVPYVLPGVISGLKVNMILGFMMLMFSETIGSKYGLGHWIHVNHLYMNYTALFAGFIEIGVLVILVNKIIEIIQRRAIEW